MRKILLIAVLLVFGGIPSFAQEDLTAREKQDLQRIQANIAKLDTFIADPSLAKAVFQEQEHRARVALEDLKEKQADELAKAEATVQRAVDLQNDNAKAITLFEAQKAGVLNSLEIFEKRVLRERLLTTTDFKLDPVAGVVEEKSAQEKEVGR